MYGFHGRLLRINLTTQTSNWVALDPAVLRQIGVAVRHALLHFDRTADRLHRTCELNQKTVAGGLYDPSLMFGDLGVDQLAPMLVESLDRALFVGADQPRIAHDVCG